MVTRFALLGDVRVWTGGRVLEIRQRQLRSVLAALLVDVNRAVSPDAVADRVWGEQLPHRPREALYSYLSRLRTTLKDSPDVTITRRSGGYLLAAEPESVDLHRFRRLVADARAADDRAATGLLTEALDLWQGEAFADLDTPWFAAGRDALARERFSARMDLTDLRLRAGGHAALVADLTALASAHPLDERVAGQLVLALYRSGRQQDALRQFERIRRALVDELGVDPGPPLLELHRQLLTSDPALLSPAPARRAEPSPARPPRQLPAAPRGFVAREAETAALTEALDGAAADGGGSSSAVVISAIAGSGGIGKTWLALHWAHRNLDRFPDGQFFVNLRGFDPSGAPMSPQVALRGFVEALGVDPKAVPLGLDAQAALYRSLIADKRLLIVLDNAADTEQVVPLLPGGPSVVLVTSRDRMAGLVGAHGARPLRLDALSEPDARSLLVARLGTVRPAAEPAAVAELLERCAGLPLALSVVAGRAQAQPGLPLATLAAELRDAATRLGALDESDDAASVRAVLSWSVAALTADQARMFGLLGVVPGPDVGLPAAASLAGTTVPEAHRVLRALERVSLVQQSGGRYRMHDLVRLYATEQPLPEEETASALRRLVDFYTYTAYTASLLTFPTRIESVLDPVTAGSHPHGPADKAAAWAWFEAEHDCLVAVERAALRHGLHVQVWLLAWHLTAMRGWQGHFGENLAAWRAGLTVARRLGDPDVLGSTHQLLGYALGSVGRHDEALDQLRQARPLVVRGGRAQRLGDLEIAFSVVLGQRGDPRAALDHAHRAVRVLPDEDIALRAKAFSMVGSLSTMLDDYAPAQEALGRSAELYRRVGDPDDRQVNRADLVDLAHIARNTGQPAKALELYERARVGFRADGNAVREANTRVVLGEVHLDLGDETGARDAWTRALEMLDAQHRVADAGRLRQRLDDLDAHVRIPPDELRTNVWTGFATGSADRRDP